MTKGALSIGAVALMCLSAGGALGCRQRPSPPSHGSATVTAGAWTGFRLPRDRPRPTDEELAIIAPLKPGSDLDEFTVREVVAVQDGFMQVICAEGESVVSLDIALTSDQGPTPPVTAGPYAVFYAVRHATAGQGERLAGKLADVLARHADLPLPKGMTPFHPTAKPPTLL